MRHPFPLAVILLALPACVVARVGDGKSATVTRTFTDATALSLENFLETTVTVEAGAQPTIELTCDGSLLDDITTEVDDGTLRIRNARPEQLLPQSDCHADVTLPALDALTVSGSGTAVVVTPAPTLVTLVVTGSGGARTAEPVTGLELVESTGSGDISLAQVDTCELSIDHTGSGEVAIGALTACEVVSMTTGSGDTRLAGGADEARLTGTGSGDFGDRGFVVGSAWITLTGSGGAELTVTDYASITLTGSGDATIFGDPPQRDVTATGSGQADFQ